MDAYSLLTCNYRKDIEESSQLHAYKHILHTHIDIHTSYALIMYAYIINKKLEGSTLCACARKPMHIISTYAFYLYC